jgi:NADH dehydrogenase/NADH:ubiquinone oxidoreductase subunit G
MQTKITPSFEPILNSLSSIGDIRSDMLAIKNIKLFDKIGKVTKLNAFSSQKLENFKTKFTINDGKIAVLPFDLNIGNIKTTVSGYNTLDQKLHYEFDMKVPKEEIPASMIKEVEAAMGKLNALVPKLDVGTLPDFIPVKVLAVGDVKDPQITTDFKEAILKATGDFKEELISSVTETVKDTIKETIQEVKENVDEEIEKQKQKILADAQKEADKVKAEAKNLADQTRAEANKQADDVVKAAGSNPIKKKLAEESAKKIRAEGENKAQKIEAEGDKKADDIMKKAQERADKLG